MRELESEDEGAKLLNKCPAGAVLVTHSPPFGVADVQTAGSHQGSRAVRAGIEQRLPRLHLCGHIHSAWGSAGAIGNCRVHNLGPTTNWFTV